MPVECLCMPFDACARMSMKVDCRRDTSHAFELVPFACLVTLMHALYVLQCLPVDGFRVPNVAWNITNQVDNYS
jgi:hypothetical protein